MRLPHGFSISPMVEEEIPILEEWAIAEGWNPGLNDLAISWKADPECFIALRQEDRLAGGGSIFNYDGQFGFMGLFIMRRDLRNKGLGKTLWHWRLDALRRRLEPEASIGMDGVFEMVPFYERGGFKAVYRDLRYQGPAVGERSKFAVTLSMSDFEEIEAYDREFIAAPRTAFLRGWLGQTGAHIVGVREDQQLLGYGVARPCQVGFKIGPLFADRTDLATEVFGELMRRIEGQQVQIDIPEPNRDALDMAKEANLSLSFGCVRLYHGPDPVLPVDRIYGVTSLEFG